MLHIKCSLPISVLLHAIEQGWVFAMAKSIFAGTVEKTGKNWQ